MSSASHDTIRRWLFDGDAVRAAWGAACLLETDAADLPAWHLAASALLALGREADAVESLRECATAAAETGNLPLALCCRSTLLRAGKDGGEILDLVASLYCRGAPRVVKDQRLAPPLPGKPAEVPDGPDRESTVVLVVRGLQAARDRSALDKSMAFESAPLPWFPLLGSLGEQNLRGLLGLMEEVYVPPGGTLMQQGEAGDAVYVLLGGRGEVVRKSRGGEETVLRRMGPGAVVGEIALVTEAPRVASVRTRDGLLALRLPRSVVEDFASKETGLADELVAFCQEKMLANLLDASPIFQRIDEGTRVAALGAFDRVIVPAGRMLVRQGEPSPGLFLIVVGEAEVLREDEAGQVLKLAQLGPADAFGEMSLLLKRPASASVRVTSDSALLALPRDRFLAVVETHPGLLAEIYRLAEEREEETRSLLGRPSESADDLTLM